jgi:hypothetical protein
MIQFERNLLSYLKRNTDYAIQLFGHWGSGKTFYIKNVLIPKISKYIKAGKSKGKINSKLILHVSLHGVKNPIELDQRIFYAMVPFFESREAGRWAASIKAFFAAASLGKVKLSFDDWLNYRMIILPRLKEILVFFDDVERSAQPLDMLKYISEMVENHGLKTVIVCNYEKLEAEGLLEIREKLIRYSFEFIANSKEFIAAYAQRKNIGKSYRAFIISHLQNLEILHGEDSLQNLRLLNDSLETFRKIFLNIKDFRSLPPSDLIHKFLHILIITNSLHNSKLQSEFKKYSENNSRNGHQELSKYRFLSAKFSKFGILGDLPRPVIDLIQKGCFDSIGIKKTWCPEIITEEQKVVKVLSSWWAEEDIEVKKALDTVVAFINQKRFALKELFSIGIHALEMVCDEIYIKEAKQVHETVKTHIRQYSSKSDGPIDFENVAGDFWLKLDHKKGDDRLVLEEFQRFFESEVGEKNKVFYEKTADHLLNTLKEKPGNFKEMSYQMRKRDVIEVFFQKLLKSDFQQIFFKTEVANLRDISFGLKYLAELSSEESLTTMQDLATKASIFDTELPDIKRFWLKKIAAVFQQFKRTESKDEAEIVP